TLPGSSRGSPASWNIITCDLCYSIGIHPWSFHSCLHLMTQSFIGCISECSLTYSFLTLSSLVSLFDESALVSDVYVRTGITTDL
ncbi:hypothetical protein C0J52_19037, partial [Blattella germanica]